MGLDENDSTVKPILKWAGGKTQLLGDLIPKVPENYGTYVEPFFGGGALYFALKPKNAIISDSNPELINLYTQVAHNVEGLIDELKKYENSEEMFYNIRKLDWKSLPEVEAAARTIYLNRTCFNGLYRVNKKGQFNVPYGRYKNPKICDESNLRAASKLLKNATILCEDYTTILKSYTKKDDFVFLDPPYIPISEYREFKRYTKEQFYVENHIELAKYVKDIFDKGCYSLITNSNHPLVFELYSDYKIEVVKTKRNISSKGNTRTGEDTIVTAYPSKKNKKISKKGVITDQLSMYPPTRFMGSKSKLLSDIWDVASKFEFDTVLDLFSGSGIVGYMFKTHNKTVISNDHMAMSATFSKAMIENNRTTLDIGEAKKLLLEPEVYDDFVSRTYAGLYFSDEDNKFIDVVRNNIYSMNDEYKQAIAMAALIRACMKKRPRGIFTYTGNRYDDGRNDLKKTFEQQFLEAVEVINNSIFDNEKQNKSIWGDAMDIDPIGIDLVYVDPPYFSPTSDNHYVRRYHFVEGLARNWEGVEIQEHTLTKKFKSYNTPFATRVGAYEAFDKLFSKFSESILIVSYSSNSIPTKDEMVEILSKYKKNVDVIPIDYKYFFGNQKDAKTHRNDVKEYLFVGY